jgi:hypothetical protein
MAKDFILSARVEQIEGEKIDEFWKGQGFKNRGDFILSVIGRAMSPAEECACPVKCLEHGSPLAESVRLAEADLFRMKNQRVAVGVLMRDGLWRDLPSIAQSIGASSVSIPAISARLREMRAAKYGGHTVNKRQVKPGLFEYQLIVDNKNN